MYELILDFSWLALLKLTVYRLVLLSVNWPPTKFITNGIQKKICVYVLRAVWRFFLFSVVAVLLLLLLRFHSVLFIFQIFFFDSLYVQFICDRFVLWSKKKYFLKYWNISTVQSVYRRARLSAVREINVYIIGVLLICHKIIFLNRKTRS